MKTVALVAGAAVGGLLLLGVVMGNRGSSVPEPRSPREAYMSGWTALRDGKAKEGSESSCAALVDPRESEDLRKAFRQGCTDRVLMHGNRSDEYADTKMPQPVEDTGDVIHGDESDPSPVTPSPQVKPQDCGWVAPPPVFVPGPPERDRYGGIIAGTEHGRWQQQPQQWVCR
ncbi:hypothetical protein ACFYM0_17875 [Streptomyces sp. NPDC006487]|uniref:hypothetical protein n=1 Tax=Streptomyces sp. NPDC006487 TaxID=3364748 RepID=UPI0036A64456